LEVLLLVFFLTLVVFMELRRPLPGPVRKSCPAPTLRSNLIAHHRNPDPLPEKLTHNMHYV